MTNRALTLIRLLGIGCGLLLELSAHGQTTVTAPIDIPLDKEMIGSGANSYEKLGIWAGIGGGQPGLFELDTGGSGFYAVSNSQTSWWGPNVTTTGTNFTETYSSGFKYSGEIVGAKVDLYSSATAIRPLVSSASDMALGQTTDIVDNKTGDTLWSSSSTLSPPPIDGTYYGDFGLSLQSSANGIVNMLGQLNYSNADGVRGGFVIHAGAHGDMNDAYLQVGVTQQQMDDFPLLFKITSTGTGFPVSNAPYYPLQLLTGTLTLSNTAASYTNASAPITLDTGNQTPVIFAPDGEIPSGLMTLDGSTTILAPGASLTLTAIDQAGAADTLLALLANTIEGVNKVNIAAPQSGGVFSFNVGLPIFEKYDVAFDFQDGLVGFRPIAVPEPGTLGLVGLGMGGLLVLLWGRRGSLYEGRVPANTRSASLPEAHSLTTTTTRRKPVASSRASGLSPLRTEERRLSGVRST